MIHAHLIIAAASSDAATGVGIPLALAAGLVSFLSPCVLPLVPGYLSTVIGVTPADLNGVGARRVLVPSLLFIASFSLIFILLGLSATALGSTLNAHKQTLEQVGGVVIIAMGVIFLATPFVGMLNREWHSESLLRLAGRGGPLVAPLTSPGADRWSAACPAPRRPRAACANGLAGAADGDDGQPRGLAPELLQGRNWLAGAGSDGRSRVACDAGRGASRQRAAGSQLR